MKMQQKRIDVLTVLFCCVCIGLIASYVTVWLPFAHDRMAKRADFLIYFTAANLPADQIYNIDAQRNIQAKTLGAPVPIKGDVLPFNHAPVLLPLMQLLIDENYESSYRRWTLVLWLVMVLCAVIVYLISQNVLLALASLSFYPVFISIMKGHDTAFVLLGLLLFTYLLKRQKDFLAGMALSLTIMKPHLSIFMAVPLIARPKALLGFSTTALVLGLYSWLLVGMRGAADFISMLRMSASGDQLEMRTLAMFNLLGLLERAGVSHETSRVIAWSGFGLCAALVVFLWLRNRSNPPIALSVLLALFTSPHLHGHDLALLVVCFATVRNFAPLLVLGSSVLLATLDIKWTNWRYSAAQVVMIVILVAVLKEEWVRKKEAIPATA